MRARPGGPLDTQAVAYAVESGEVARCFGGRDDVVRRHRVPGMRQTHTFDGAATSFETRDRVAHGKSHGRVEALAEVLVGNADTKAACALVASGFVVVPGGGRRRRVPRVVARDDAENARGAAHVRRKCADLVEA